MATIFTDDFSYTELDISIEYSDGGRRGDLTFSSEDNREFRLRLSDDQLAELSSHLDLHGYGNDYTK